MPHPRVLHRSMVFGGRSDGVRGSYRLCARMSHPRALLNPMLCGASAPKGRVPSMVSEAAAPQCIFLRDGDRVPRNQGLDHPRWCAVRPHPCADFPRWSPGVSHPWSGFTPMVTEASVPMCLGPPMVSVSIATIVRVYPDGGRGFRTHVPWSLDGDRVSRTHVPGSPRW